MEQEHGIVFPSARNPMEFREKKERKSKKVSSNNAGQRTPGQWEALGVC